MRQIIYTVLTGGLITCFNFGQTATAQDHSHGDTPNELWSQADAYYDPEEMASSRAHVLHHNGDQMFAMFDLERAEIQLSEDEDRGVWDGSFWYGGDVNKLYVTSEGEYSFDHEEWEEAEIQLLWSRAVSTYFDVQAGVRYDIEPEGTAHVVLGFHGVAPYWFEVDGAAYLSEHGDLTADFEVEYDFLLTQRLILQARSELQFAGQDIPDQDVGAGLTNLEAGLRLRYEIEREFAPYLGVEYQSTVGETRNILNAMNEDPDQLVWVVGVRSWF